MTTAVAGSATVPDRQPPDVVGQAPAAHPPSTAQPAVDLPWHAENALRMLAQVAIGAVGLLVTWAVVSGKSTYSEQLAWLVAAVVLTAIGAVGMVGWLVSGTRTVRAERARLEAELAATLEAGVADTQAAGDLPDLVTAPRMTRLHVRSCLLVQGKPDLVPPASGDFAVLQWCSVCLDEDGRAR